MQSSVWKTQGTGEDWWAADFQDGDTKVLMVKLTLERRYPSVMPEDKMERMYGGIQVYIGEQLCGTVGRGEGEHWLFDYYMGEIPVHCPSPYPVGSSVKVTFPNTEVVLVTDIQVHSALPKPAHLNEVVPSVEKAPRCAYGD